jgi:hypothetical protein
MSIELLRSSVFGGFAYPELHFVCTGLSMLNSYELEEREREKCAKRRTRKILNTKDTKKYVKETIAYQLRFRHRKVSNMNNPIPEEGR